MAARLLNSPLCAIVLMAAGILCPGCMQGEADGLSGGGLPSLAASPNGPQASVQPEPVPEHLASPAAEPAPAAGPVPAPGPVAPPAAQAPPLEDPNRPSTGPTVRFIGRFDASNPNVGSVFKWSASAIETRVLGTGLSIALSEPDTERYQGVPVNNAYEVLVDGAYHTTFSASPNQHSYVAAQGLPEGEHVVRVIKRTEAQMGAAIFRGFTPAAGGRLLPAPRPPSRRIEFIGDSITCGYGADGNVARGKYCPFTVATENAAVSYASVAAATLGADFTAIAWSGKGIVQNNDCNGDPYYTMPVLYPATVPLQDRRGWDFNSWVPQAVVINLGTNDYNEDNGCGIPDSADFTEAWVGLIKQVRANYPRAVILCTVGPDLRPPVLPIAQANIQAAVQERQAAGDANVRYFELAENTGADGWGCAAHPNRKTHIDMAAVTVAALRAALGW